MTEQQNPKYTSVSQKIWLQREYKSKPKHYNNIHPIVIDLLAKRGITNPEEISLFLNPTLKNNIPNPLMLLDMKIGVERTIQAILKKENIAIFADYDVDGTTSASILKKYLNKLGHNAFIYTPDRLKEGYGPNCNAFRLLKNEHNTELCITVDCGIVANEPIQTAVDLGMDVIVIDHHIGTEKMPPAVAIINPNRIDEAFPHKSLSAAGVVFLFLIALQSKLKESNFFTTIPEPHLIEYLDLVAISTICDIVPLTNLNRALVKKGIEVINNKKNIALCALMSVMSSHFPITEQDIAFGIGPRINSCGRIGTARLAVELLTNENYQTSYDIAIIIEKLNNTRRSMDGDVFTNIINQINKDNPPSLIMLHNKEWHQGIIGIVAGKIKEHTNCTTIIISVNNDIGKGSMRGVEGVNCGTMIAEAKEKNLIIDGGGHEAAGGFSMHIERFQELHNFFMEKISSESPTRSTPKKYFDLILSPNEINYTAFQQISLLGPFGNNNPEPIILLCNAVIRSIKVLKEKHLSLIISDIDNNTNIKALIFNATNSPVYDAISVNAVVNLVGTLSLNTWNNRITINFIAQDIIKLEHDIPYKPIKARQSVV